MDWRRQITMSAAELGAFLASQRTVVCGIRFRPTRVSSWDHRKLR